MVFLTHFPCFVNNIFQLLLRDVRAWLCISTYVGKVRAEKKEMARTEEERVVGNESSSDEKNDLVEEIQQVIESVVQFGDYRRTQRKESHNLVRRFKLMLPLLEELRDLPQPFPEIGVAWLTKLKDALLLAKDLLKLCSQGSKIHLVIFLPSTFI